MINLSEYLQDEDCISFLDEIRLALSEDYLNEVYLSYKGKTLSIEPVDGKVVVFYGDTRSEFENVDELFLHFILDGKTFIEQIKNIEYN